MKEQKSKKKIYKRWWFWVLTVVIICASISSNSNSSKQKSSEKTAVKSSSNSTQKNSVDKSNSKSKVKEKTPKTRDNSKAITTTLQTGSFVVGQDIPIGRYVCSADSQGNFVVYDKNGIPSVNEILGDGNLGVTSVTIDIKDGEKIEISGIRNVTFTPAETKLLTELTTGSWEVGLDIAEGRYIASSAKGQGNFVVYRHGVPVKNEILDASGKLGVPNVTLELKAEDVVKIRGLEKTIFTAK